jgi:hypothetical protein
MRDYGDGDGFDDGKKGPKKWFEWECPRCDAVNPNDDGFKYRDELFCFYCGAEFKVVEKDSGYKLKDA